MGRRRTIPDDVALAAVLDLVRRVGPEGVTFAAAAVETGLSGATLVQRYGSRDGMVRAAILLAWDALDARTAELDGTAAPTPRGAVEMLVGLSHGYADADSFADGLLLLREDLRDPVLRQRGAIWGAALERALDRRLDPEGRRGFPLGRMMMAQWQGIVLWWGFEQVRPVEEEVARALSTWCIAAGLAA
ncbi:TetR/AcrR family transcriptional regulator [Arenibaculum pallidiluteum]|uniref:TetR/AcrR family transcriptional regulator n=1 Tax=Arenibaculum pallidiluteum TaxID=2812559 RepID=UPI001A96A585|nr:TetR/AcrR family transcriptional regulator [Arenibaculum pallidiluteum]